MNDDGHFTKEDRPLRDNFLFVFDSTVDHEN